MEIIVLLIIVTCATGQDVWDDKDWYNYITSDDQDEAEMLASVIYYMIWALLPIMIVSTLLIRKRGMDLCIFNIIQYVQFIRYLPGIEVDIPPYYGFFMREFVKIFDYDDILNDGDGKDIDQQHLYALRIETSLFIWNAEMDLFIWCGFLILFIVTLWAWSQEMKSMMRYSMLYYIFFLTTMDMWLYAWIQLQHIDFSGTMPLVSSVLSVIYLVAFCWVLSAIIYSTISYTGNYEQDFRSFQILIEGAGEYRSVFSYQYYSLFIVVRMGTSIFIVVLYESEKVVFGFVLALQTIMMIYVLMVKPWEMKKEQASVAITEICNLLSVAHIGLYLTDDWDYDERKWTSIAGFCVLVLWIVANLGFFVSFAINSGEHAESKIAPMPAQVTPKRETLTQFEGNPETDYTSPKDDDDNKRRAMETEDGVGPKSLSHFNLEESEDGDATITKDDPFVHILDKHKSKLEKKIALHDQKEQEAQEQAVNKFVPNRGAFMSALLQQTKERESDFDTPDPIMFPQLTKPRLYYAADREGVVTQAAPKVMYNPAFEAPIRKKLGIVSKNPFNDKPKQNDGEFDFGTRLRERVPRFFNK